jgi:RNA 2',3'-cyclic 3'-phosphodiesterase
MARDRASRPEAKSRRLFVAVEIPEEAQRAVDVAIAPWKEEMPQARWSPPENRHVTAKFLGAVWPRLIDTVFERVAAVAKGATAFRLTLVGLGRFPERGNARVLWAGLEDPTNGLAGLASALDAALAPDVAPETRPYHPHLTVARSNPPVAVPEGWIETWVSPISWTVERLVLFESHLQRPHARYEPVAVHPLSA